MATRSKLSCLSWNKYSKNVIASSDYEGIVTVWDVQTRQVSAVYSTIHFASAVSLFKLRYVESVCCIILECDGVWRAWEESVERWFFSYRTFNASIREWWLQGIWKFICPITLALSQSMKSLVIAQINELKTLFLFTWAGGCSFLSDSSLQKL